MARFITALVVAGSIAALASVLLSSRPASRQIAATTPPASGPDQTRVRRYDLPAFAGAEGYGAMAAGGRGGQVVRVTTLADHGEGSLRACIDMAGPRICTFTVSGLIRFTGRPPVISRAFLTIAGQTSPGGITLTHSGGKDGVTPLLIKNTHDIVIRDIRVRTDRRGAVRGGNDAITFENSRNVILDHVSGSWALDENINGQGDNDNITISWSIFAEGVPDHDKCALLGSDPTGPQRLSFIYNLCAHNGDRNPDMNFVPGSCIDVINNVFYNGGRQFAEIWESYGGTTANIVGNTFRAGPSTSKSAIGIDRQTIGSTGAARAFLAGNAFDGPFTQEAAGLAEILAERPLCPLSITPMNAQVAYRAVLQQAGAMPRDAVDRRIVDEVRDRTGRIRKEPAGPIPHVPQTLPPPDQDRDSMPDMWEVAHGTSPTLSDPWQDANGNGVPNLDEYLDDAHRALTAQTPELSARPMLAGAGRHPLIAAMLSALTP